MVHEVVGRINGAFGTLTYVPIHHLDRQLSFHELVALYAVTGERRGRRLAAGGWWLVAGGWWLVAGGWWLVAGGWWLVAGGWWLVLYAVTGEGRRGLG
jgi:hypothetical protein